MGLQIRLRQTSGEKVIGLTDRSIDRPVVIGSSKTAQVPIASDVVAAEHCALFVHEGRWALHDGSGGRTLINGKAVKRPTKLRIGDIVSLGTGESAPTLLIDPAGAAAGRTGQPAMGDSAIAAAPKEQKATPASPRPAPTAAKPAVAPSQVAPVLDVQPPPVEQLAAPAAADENDPFAALASAATASRAGAADVSTPRRKAAKKKSNAGMIVGVLVCLAIIGATAWVVRQRLQHPSVVKVIELPAPAPTTPPRVASIAADPLRPMAGDIAPVKRHAAPVAPTTARDDTDPDDDASAAATRPGGASGSTTRMAANRDDTWAEVEAASFSPDYGLALLKFDDYHRQHPTQFSKEIDELTAQALDRLWWTRIKDLCAKRDRLALDLRKKNQEIKEEPSVSFRKTLTDEKKALDDEMAATLTALNGDMGYASDDAPDLTNEDSLTKLAAERDAIKFAAWKISVLKFIRSHHGSTPWDGDN